VENCQFARERGPIYRRGTRVRVFLSGPNGPGWNGFGPKHVLGSR
jgi:hypothetical protein